MAEYKIYPLKLGEFPVFEKSSFLYLKDAGVKIVTPVIAFLVQGNGRNILVDTGCSGPEWSALHHRELLQTEDMQLLNALAAHGVTAEDVDCVINTHLHWDHCWNNDLFPGKKIYVQKAEMELAKNPLPCQWNAYETEELGLTPPYRKTLDQYVLVEGDAELFEGIRLIFTPSHTPGCQSVLVDTSDGKYLIASDVLSLYENWDGDGKQKHIPTAIHVDLAQCYETYARIEALCDHILPGHDIRVFENEVYPPDV